MSRIHHPRSGRGIFLSDRDHRLVHTAGKVPVRGQETPVRSGRIGKTAMKVLVRTPDGVEEVVEVDSDWVIPGDVLGDGSVVLELWDELSDDDYLAMGLYD